MGNYTFRFYIKPRYTKTNGKTPIYIRYYERRNHITLLDTKLEVNPNNWSISKNHPKVSKVNEKLIRQLDEKKLRVANIVSFALKNEILPTREFVKMKFFSEQEIKSSLKQLSFFEELDDYIESKKNMVVADVIKDYNSLKKHLNEFEEYQNTIITFKSINLEFYNLFVEYLTYHVIKKNGEIGMLTNSVGKQIKNLKAFLNNRMLLKKIEQINLIGFKTLTEEVDDIYLTKDDIEKIKKVELRNDSENTVRDLLLLGCLTGLRYSDLIRINKDQIRDGLLFIKQKKVHKQVVIPLKKDAIDILSKYNYNTPQTKGNIFNSLVKKIGEKAKINDIIETIYKRGNKKDIRKNRKFELISSHTCRRSFCTNEFLDNTPVHLIMKISGHKTEKAFMRYLKISEYEAALKMKEAWGL